MKTTRGVRRFASRPTLIGASLILIFGVGSTQLVGTVEAGKPKISTKIKNVRVVAPNNIKALLNSSRSKCEKRRLGKLFRKGEDGKYQLLDKDRSNQKGTLSWKLAKGGFFPQGNYKVKVAAKETCRPALKFAFL